MATIEELLHRRTDLSTFVVHFTRPTDGRSSRDNLLRILGTRRLEARTVHGMGKDLVTRYPALAPTQRTVCFTETPLEHAWMMCSEIDGRSVQFDGYGVAFTKTFARRKGANPVWYIDITAGHDWLTSPIKDLLLAAEKAAAKADSDEVDTASLKESPILRITPFIEQMGAPAGTRKEFWWEREWRHVGGFRFFMRDVVVAFAPEAEHEQLHEALEERLLEGVSPPVFVDARWGLERMIGALANVHDMGPFPG